MTVICIKVNGIPNFINLYLEHNICGDCLTISICQCEFFGNNPMCCTVCPYIYSIFNYLKLKKMKNKIDQYYISVGSRTNLLYNIHSQRA